ncbi:MAG: protein of unknown function with transrane region [Candidatus Parcubacteria bacterium]|nr:protein of unknown function with transrane region [Candidatus Parcubacteria bacterium]
MQPQVFVPSVDFISLGTPIGEWIVNFYPHLIIWIKDFVSLLIVISFPVSVFLLIAIIYCVEQLKRIKKADAKKYDLKVEPAFEDVKASGNADLSAQWEKVTSLLNSENQNDWKQAILEADTMLDKILNSLGYQGSSIGEKLKRVQPGEFKSVQEAWDAHKVRNQIAHDGAAFQVTHHLANHTIQQYRKVFEEFYYI